MDTAFKAAAFPGYTTDELRERARIAACTPGKGQAAAYIKLLDEIERREKAAAGDTSVMTDGERLRFIRTGKAR